MALAWPDKDPDEILDYAIDWVARLGEDTIASSVWTVPDGLTESSAAIDGTTTSLFLAGGSDGTRYKIENRITTTGGRTMEEVVAISVKGKV